MSGRASVGLLLLLLVAAVTARPAFAASGGSGSVDAVCSEVPVTWESTGEAVESGVTVTGTITFTAASGPVLVRIQRTGQSTDYVDAAPGTTTVSAVSSAAGTWHLYVYASGESVGEACDGGSASWSSWSVTGGAAPTPTPTPTVVELAQGDADLVRLLAVLVTAGFSLSIFLLAVVAVATALRR